MRSYQMSWIPKLFRWSKMVDGKRYVVSVRQLRKYFNERFIPETKEGSYQWANKWIEQQRNQAIKQVEEPVYHLELVDMETNEPTGEFINVKKSDYDSQYAAKMETKNRFNRFWDSLHDAPEILPDKLIGSLVDKYLETQFLDCSPFSGPRKMGVLPDNCLNDDVTSPLPSPSLSRHNLR